MKSLICRIFGHKWQEIHIEKKSFFPYSVTYKTRCQCSRCGIIVNTADERLADKMAKRGG